MNVGQWIQYVTAELAAAPLTYGHGTDNPGDEAAWLVLHTVGARLDGSFEAWDRPVTRNEAARIRHFLSDRIEHKAPLAYVLGSAWFAGLEFEVDRTVLVPRSPIAELILERFEPWLNVSGTTSVLDLCTGSGCIAVATAVNLPQAKIDAADISSAALAVARRNVCRHDVGSRVQLIQSDLFAGLTGRSYDLIVTNPPYVPATALRDLPIEYHAEPEQGLVSGADGLDACLQILSQAPGHMKGQGILVCEVGESEHRLADLLPTVPFLWLEFSNGGSGVFILSRQELLQASAAVGNAIEERSHVA